MKFCVFIIFDFNLINLLMKSKSIKLIRIILLCSLVVMILFELVMDTHCIVNKNKKGNFLLYI